MARKKKPEDPPPSKAYLVSFGDTMTTLLAFFIVLCSMAEEQTGANLYRGTGSFVASMEGHGLPGAFQGKTTANAIEQHHTSPHYIAPDLDGNPSENNATGPDEENGIRSISRETEVFTRFLNEMEVFSSVEKLPETTGEVVFDFFNALPSEPPYLDETYKRAILRIVPTLGMESKEVDLVVWATTPSPTAWNRAIERATRLVDELAEIADLQPEELGRLHAIGKPWLFSDVKRPVVSIIVKQLDRTGTLPK